MDRDLKKLENLFQGMKEMKKLPSAIFIVDINYDDIALTEAKTSKVPIIAIVDSNSNPENVDYIIPSNDDATKAIDIIVGAVASAIGSAKTAIPAKPASLEEKAETKQPCESIKN